MMAESIAADCNLPADDEAEGDNLDAPGAGGRGGLSLRAQPDAADSRERGRRAVLSRHAARRDAPNLYAARHAPPQGRRAAAVQDAVQGLRSVHLSDGTGGGSGSSPGLVPATRVPWQGGACVCLWL